MKHSVKCANLWNGIDMLPLVKKTGSDCEDLISTV